jgi:site-specific DNA recombinase
MTGRRRGPASDRTATTPRVELDGYVRVSRVRARAGPSFTSPGLQRDLIERWAALEGHTISRWHTDLDRSGASDDRPGFRAAIDRAESGACDGIVVAKLDRFARSLISALAAIRRLEAAGAVLVSVDEGLDLSTPAGTAITRMIIVIAEHERDRLKEGWDEANRRAVARGVHVSSVVPYGYRRAADGLLEPDPCTAPLVTGAFRLRAECRSYPAVREWLHSSVPPSERPGWGTGALVKLLANRVYLGEARSGRHRRPGAHPPLVDRATFELAAGARCISGQREGREPAMLAGLLRCAGCRYCLKRGGQAATPPARRLSTCQPVPGRPACPRPVKVRTGEVERLVEERFFEMLARPPFSPRPSAAGLAAAEGALEEAERRVAWEPGGRRPSAAAHRELARARRDLVQTARSAILPDPRRLRREWDSLPPIERRRHLAMALDAVFVRDAPGRDLSDRVLLVPLGRGPDDLPRTRVSVPQASFRWPSPMIRAHW